MTALTIPNTISTNDNIEAAPHAENYAAIESHVNTEVVSRDGSVAMTAELQLVDGNNAASKTYVDTAVNDVLPPGAVTMWAGPAAPAGFLFCQGQSVSRSTYLDLFTAIGTQFGSASGTTFNVPNLKGRVPVGVDAGDSSWNVLGETGGSKNAVAVTHTHADTFTVPSGGEHTTTVNPPAADLAQISWGGKNWHALLQTTGGDATTGVSNTVFSTSSGAASIAYADLGGAPAQSVNIPSFTTASGGAHAHTVSGSVTSAGESGTNKNLQPYIALNFVIKT